MDIIRVEFIGTGRISDLHAIEYLNNPHTEDAVITTDFHELLALEQVDLVEILLPHHLHVEAALAAFAAGKAVSLQKPMAITLEGADRLIAGAQRAGVAFRVFENFIFYPPVAKALVEAGAIGTPLTIRIKSNAGSRACAWKVPPGRRHGDRAQAGPAAGGGAELHLVAAVAECQQQALLGDLIHEARSLKPIAPRSIAARPRAARHPAGTPVPQPTAATNSGPADQPARCAPP